MRSKTEVLKLYDAFAAEDLAGLRSVLSEDLIGHVSAGMPCGVGGIHHGPDAMIEHVWLRLAREYRVGVIPHDVHWTDDDRAVVRGYYEVTPRKPGVSARAEFVHLLTFNEDGRITELRQITDTAAWALAGAET